MVNIPLSVVGKADLSQPIEQMKYLSAETERLSAAISRLYAIQKNPVASLGSVQDHVRAMNSLIAATGAYTVHTVKSDTAVGRLGERLQRNKATWSDLGAAISRTHNQHKLYTELGTRHVSMMRAVSYQVGNQTHLYQKNNFELKALRDQLLAKAVTLGAVNNTLHQGATKLVNWGKNTQWAGRQLTVGLTYPLLMFGAAAAKVFKDVDTNLARLAKVYGTGLQQPTSSALAKIREDVLSLSKELSKAYGVAASDTSDLAAEFAAAGLEGKQLLDSTRQAAKMMVLGEVDKQEAVKATIALQTAYKLNTEGVTEAVNFLNAAQAATSTNMQDLVEAIPRVGPVIRGLGGSYKDMVAIITALKEGGVSANEAANAIKNSLGRIINPTKSAKEALQSFGIDIEGIVSKNAGNLVGTIKELQAGLLKLDGLSRQKAISELFGKYQFARMSAFIENFGQVGSQSLKVMEMMGMSANQLADITDKQTQRMVQTASKRFQIALETLKTSLIPLGEKFLNLGTNVLNFVDKIIKYGESLPGFVKQIAKMGGALVLVAGPLMMLMGLFGNFAGSILKVAINGKVLFNALSLWAQGGGRQAFSMVRALSRSFEVLDAAEAAARNSTNLLATANTEATGAEASLKAAIENTTAAIIAQTEELAANAVAKQTAMQTTTMATGTTFAGGSTSPVNKKAKRRKPQSKTPKVVVPPIVSEEETPAPVGAPGSKFKKFGAAGLGLAATIGGMTLATHGHETSGEALSMAGLTAMMLAGTGIALSLVAGIAAAVAAAVILVKTLSNYIQSLKDARAAAANTFGASAKEIDIFSLKIKNLSDMNLPELTEAQKKANDTISNFAEQIKALDAKDPLKLFAESLKSMTLEDRLKKLQEKYLTLRVEGMSDADARSAIQGILRAAGLETGTIGLAPMLNKASTMENQLAAQQAAASATAGRGQHTVTDMYGNKYKSRQGSGYRQIVTQNAQTLGNYIVNNGMKAVEELSKLSLTYKKGSQDAEFFNQSVRKMYQASGIGTEAFVQLKRNGASTSEVLTLFNMRMSGAISTTEQWDRALKDSAYRMQLVEGQKAKEQITSAESTLSSDLSGVLNTTSASVGQTVKQKTAQQQIDAQKKYLDALKAELDTRNKIISAQEKSLEYQNAKANLQQQYDQAIASGDASEAARIKREMALQDAKRKQDLETTARQNKIAKEEDKLKNLESKKTTIDSLVAASNRKTTITVDSVNKKYTDMIRNMITQGKDVSGTISTWANDLQSKFGGNIDKIKEKINTFVTSIKTADLTQIGQAMAGSFDGVLDKAQQLAVINRANNLLETNKKLTIDAAYQSALQETVGADKKVIWNKKKGGFDIVSGGKGRSDAGSTKLVQFIKMANLTDNPANRARGGIIMGYKGGSFGGVWGPGSSTSDSIPAYLSNGEYVINASAVSKTGTKFMDQLNSMGYSNAAPLMRMMSASGSPVIPVEIAPSSNGGSLYNDHSTINVYVNQTNASPDAIANAVYGAIQRRENMVGTRTAIKS